MASDRRRLVVLGCGFGGFSLLSRLRKADEFELTLVTPRNYFLFTPLLTSSAVGTVEFRSILEPAPQRLPEVRLIEASAETVDWEAREVVCRGALDEEESFRVPYDDLVIAVGARVGDYGVEGALEQAVPFYTLEDARTVRRRLLEQFARAELPEIPEEERRRLLTFVVCGGGPTGVEIAAEIDDLVDGEMRRAYPELARLARVIVVEALERLLTGFDEALAEYTREHFSREGIEVRVGAMVERIEPGVVHFEEGEPLEAGLVVWAGGNQPVELVASLDEPKSERGRLLVDPYLRLLERPNVYALGDCATPSEPTYPATAQVAQQQGKYLARAMRRRAAGETTEPFHFDSHGMLAYIGSSEALADLPQAKWSGRTAWLFWRSVYLTRLVGLPNKVKVLFDWAKTSAFGRDLSRF